MVLAVAAYNLTRAAINEAATALKLSPRQFSFSMARDTVRAFLPLLDPQTETAAFYSQRNLAATLFVSQAQSLIYRQAGKGDQGCKEKCRLVELRTRACHVETFSTRL